MALSEGMSIADAMALKDNDGMFGGNGGLWVFFLFFLLAWGNGGFGGNNNAAMQGALTRADLTQGFDFQNLTMSINDIGRGIADGFYTTNMNTLNGVNQVQQSINNGFANTTNQLCENRFAQQQCCCETNRNIDALKYENERNTCAITSAIHDEAEQTRALITSNTIQDLRDKIAENERALLASTLVNAQQIQTQNLVTTLRPFPTPAYITCSPYTSYYNGCSNGCGGTCA